MIISYKHNSPYLPSGQYGLFAFTISQYINMI